LDTIKGERLTTWSILPSGEQVSLGFADATGRSHTILLPVTVLSALMMTIPRMLCDALKTRFADGSLRMIHELGSWRVERAVGTDASILSLATPDGFEVTFAVATPQADRLAQTLRHAAAPAAADASFLH